MFKILGHVHLLLYAQPFSMQLKGALKHTKYATGRGPFDTKNPEIDASSSVCTRFQMQLTGTFEYLKTGYMHLPFYTLLF